MNDNDGDNTDPHERVWEDGFEGPERLRRQRQAQLPLEEKLKWLEEADALARHLAAQSPATQRESQGKE
jgi:hypothetical protein